MSRLALVALILMCATILATLLFFALWDYREWVGISLLALFILGTIVHINGKVNEQSLRRDRFRHQEEIPLDAYGEAQFLPPGTSENPKRR